MSGILAQRQADFMRAILDEDAPLPDGWGNSQTNGMRVYRGNYRGALMSALEATYERTARYVGEKPFKQAGSHHLIGNPPSGWTIDEAGAGFDATCEELFGENPEVAELAWLEWAMLQVTTAPDMEPMKAEEFGQATAEFDDQNWMNLRLEFQPRTSTRNLRYNLTSLWNALAYDGLEVPVLEAASQYGCIVWREGHRPIFMVVDPDNARCFSAMQDGATYGELIGSLAGDEPDDAAVQDAAMQAGQMLGGWLTEGMIVSLKT